MGMVKILVLTLFGLALSWPAASPAEATDARVNMGTVLRVDDRKHERDDHRRVATSGPAIITTTTGRPWCS